MSRLHIICCDHNLCHAASLLKIGGIQIVLAMIEAGCIEPSLILDDPVRAMRDWSHDPSLKTTASLISGAKITAVDWQRRFLESAHQFARQGRCSGIVPEADRILELWSDTLEKLAQARFEQLTGRLDWVLKRAILEQAIHQHHLAWTSPALKQLDHLYSDLDPNTGLYWAYERAGVVERWIPERHISRREFEPPETTRAWTRGALLGLAQPDQIDTIDWDHIRFRFSQRTGWPRTVTVPLSNPLKFTRRETEYAFPPDGDLETALAVLGSDDTPPVGSRPAFPTKQYKYSNLAITRASNNEDIYGPKPEDKNPNE